MTDKKKVLDELLTLVKGLQTEVKTLKENGKDVLASDKSRAMLDEILQKRELVIKDQILADMRKGEFAGESEETDPHSMIISKAVSDQQKSFQNFNDDVYLISKVLRVHPSQTKLWKKNQAQVGELRKALNATTSTQGQNWVPTEFSSELIDKFRLELKVGALFRTVNMPSNPYKFPLVGGDATGYLIAEETADSGTKITASQATTNQITLTAKKLAARTLFSEELSEDSIVPVLPFLKENLARVMGDTWEKAIINGDTAATHLDVTDVTSATDAQKAYDGLRKAAKNFNNLVALTTFNSANLRSIRTKMGKYGVNPRNLVWITGPKGYAQLLANSDVSTVDKYGQFATLLVGELAKFDGIPIVVSEHVKENLSTTGYYDGTTTNNTVLILANYSSFLVGDKRKFTLKTFEDIQTDQTILVVTMRRAFAEIYSSSTEGIANVGYDVDAA